MKRHGNLFEKIVDIDNIRLAYKNAKKGKSRYKEVRMIEQNPEFYLRQIQEMLQNKTFTTSEYQIADIRDKKKIRTIHKLPFFPDRIVHHALIQIIEPILIGSLIRDTFQSIKGRGISDARKRVTRYIRKNQPIYCLQMDVQKYYPSVNNQKLKNKIRTKIKCSDTLWLIDDIINSTIGLPIGNYTSQHFGNFYLNSFDHWIKGERKIKGYFRYCDDIIFLTNTKSSLHFLKNSIINFLNSESLFTKPNWRIFPIEKQGLDFCGYIFRNSKITLRKSISNSFKDKIKTINNKEFLSKNDVSSIMSFFGWLKVINLKSLWNILANYENLFRYPTTNLSYNW